MRMTDCSVLIAGAGPTGLVLAYELARRGVVPRIIDMQTERAQASKAIALQAKSLEMFDLMGLPTDGFRKLGHGVKRGVIYDHSGEKKIVDLDFSKLPSRYQEMFLIPQWETERFLEQKLTELGVDVDRGCKLVSFEEGYDGIDVRLARPDGSVERASASWLIGCDGGHSAVRELAQISFEGSTYANIFALADVHIDGRLEQDRFVVFTHEDGPLAIFPLGNGRYRVIADNPPDSFGENPTLQACQAIVDERGPGDLKLRDSIWISRARIHRRTAGELRKGRIFIAGDAANIHSPAGGQGMNTGMQDAFNLGWKLALAVQGRASEALLDSYGAERQPVEDAVVRASDFITRMVTLKSPVARFLRDHIAPVLTEIAPIKARIGENIAELEVSYRGSEIVLDRPISGGELRAGDPMPDLLVEEDQIQSKLFSRISCGTHIVLMTGRPAPDFSNLAISGVDWPAARMEQAIAKMSWGGEINLGREPGLYVIRPDGFIGLRCPADGAAYEFVQKYRALIESTGQLQVQETAAGRVPSRV